MPLLCTYLSHKGSPMKSKCSFLCETRDFCTDECGGCVGHRASGEAVGLIRSTVRGSLLRWRLSMRPIPQRGRLGLGRWHSQGKRRKGQAVLAAGLRSQVPLGRASPDSLGATANVGGTILSSASSVRVIRSLESIPASSKWEADEILRQKDSVSCGCRHRSRRPFS
jgi:hypothetical protein